MLSTIRALSLLAIMLGCVNKVDANVDSLRQIWSDVTQPDTTRFNAINEYYKINLFSQPDSVILLSAYHVELAQQKNSQNERAIAFNEKAIAFTLKGDYNNSVIEMNKAINIYNSLNDAIGLARTYNNLANIYTYTDEYQEAIKFFSKSLAFYRENKMKDLQASVLMNIGRIHLDINNYDLALNYFNESLHIYEGIDEENRDEVGNIWLNIGYANLGKENYYRAIKNSQEALKVYQPLNEQYYIANSYTLTAKIYQKINQIDSALFYIENSIKLHESIGNDVLALEDQIILANLILPTDVHRATKIGEKVLKSVDTCGDKNIKIDLYDLLYNCYKKNRNYPLSLSMLEKYTAYTDSLLIEENQIAITKKAIQNEYETKIFNAQLENEQSQSQLKQKQLKRTYTILFLGSSVLLCILFFFRAKRIILNKQKEALLNKINHLKELENTQHQIIQSDKMASLGQLTAGVAHEINNPVNFISAGVRGFKKTLNEYIQTPKGKAKGELLGDMNDMIRAIEEGARRTSNIVKSLRLFSREDTENYAELDIITELESTFTLLSEELKKGVVLEKYFEKETMTILCYPGQLNQVFMNIMLNAIQAVDGKGTIRVGVKEQGNSVAVSISDNGPGISDDKKRKIFEPFYTTKSIQEGRGLGLSISFGIIKKHKGSIDVKDNEPKGTKFVINLPKREDGLVIQ